MKYRNGKITYRSTGIRNAGVPVRKIPVLSPRQRYYLGPAVLQQMYRWVADSRAELRWRWPLVKHPTWLTDELFEDVFGNLSENGGRHLQLCWITSKLEDNLNESLRPADRCEIPTEIDRTSTKFESGKRIQRHLTIILLQAWALTSAKKVERWKINNSA